MAAMAVDNASRSWISGRATSPRPRRSRAIEARTCGSKGPQDRLALGQLGRRARRPPALHGPSAWVWPCRRWGGRAAWRCRLVDGGSPATPTRMASLTCLGGLRPADHLRLPMSPSVVELLEAADVGGWWDPSMGPSFAVVRRTRTLAAIGGGGRQRALLLAGTARRSASPPAIPTAPQDGGPRVGPGAGGRR